MVDHSISIVYYIFKKNMYWVLHYHCKNDWYKVKLYGVVICSEWYSNIKNRKGKKRVGGLLSPMIVYLKEGRIH